MDLLTGILISPDNINDIAEEISRCLASGPFIVRLEFQDGEVKLLTDMQLLHVTATLPKELPYQTNSAHLEIVGKPAAIHLKTSEDPVITWTHLGSFTIQLGRSCINDDDGLKTITITYPPVVKK